MIDSKNMALKIGEKLVESGIPFVTGLTTDEYEPLPVGITEAAELRCVIDDETLKALLSLNPSNNYTLSYTTETNIPNRKNKRKRIQKKWNKKYGFKFKTVRMDGMKMRSITDGDICTFEAIKTNQ